jgi:hypothetical protein
MQYTGRPTLASDYTMSVFGGHYGFAHFGYRTAKGVQTQTYLIFGDTEVLMPIGAVYCIAMTAMVPMLLIAATVLFFKCRRRPL